MVKRMLAVCLFMLLTLMLTPIPGYSINVDVQDFYNRIGVGLDGASGEPVVGASYTGVVSNPEKLEALGFTGAGKGDKVKVQIIDRGKSTLLLMSTGQKKTILLK